MTIATREVNLDNELEKVVTKEMATLTPLSRNNTTFGQRLDSVKVLPPVVDEGFPSAISASGTSTKASDSPETTPKTSDVPYTETAKTNPLPTPVVRPAGSNVSEIQQRNDKIVTEGPYKGLPKSEAVKREVQAQSSSLAAQRQNMENASRQRIKAFEEGVKTIIASKDVEIGRLNAHYAEVEAQVTAMIQAAQQQLSDLIARLEHETTTANIKREEFIAHYNKQMQHLEAMLRAERASLAALVEPDEELPTIDPMTSPARFAV